MLFFHRHLNNRFRCQYHTDAKDFASFTLAEFRCTQNAARRNACSDLSGLMLHARVAFALVLKNIGLTNHTYVAQSLQLLHLRLVDCLLICCEKKKLQLHLAHQPVPHKKTFSKPTENCSKNWVKWHNL